jgi:glycosyltransferase involved in cell wall biosynthesis
VAIIAAYNEERFLGACLEHLFTQGVEVYLCDNESTDRTVEIASGYLDRGVVGIETLPRDGTYRWRGILARKEQLAAQLNADWFLHVDPDEILEPALTGQTLAVAFTEADRAGDNAVEFDELVFVATREMPDHDHADFQRTMRWYYPFEPRPSRWRHPFQRRAHHRVIGWKRQAKVDLVRSGGHQAEFPGRRISPQRFFLRHYLVLSHEQMVRKYVQRHYDPAEVRDGWHGWRARLGASDIQLPSQSELRFTADGTDLDASSPFRRHFIEW